MDTLPEEIIGTKTQGTSSTPRIPANSVPQSQDLIVRHLTYSSDTAGFRSNDEINLSHLSLCLVSKRKRRITEPHLYKVIRSFFDSGKPSNIYRTLQSREDLRSRVRGLLIHKPALLSAPQERTDHLVSLTSFLGSLDYLDFKCGGTLNFKVLPPAATFANIRKVYFVWSKPVYYSCIYTILRLPKLEHVILDPVYAHGWAEPTNPRGHTQQMTSFRPNSSIKRLDIRPIFTRIETSIELRPMSVLRGMSGTMPSLETLRVYHAEDNYIPMFSPRSFRWILWFFDTQLRNTLRHLELGGAKQWYREAPDPDLGVSKEHQSPNNINVLGFSFLESLRVDKDTLVPNETRNWVPWCNLDWVSLPLPSTLKQLEIRFTEYENGSFEPAITWDATTVARLIHKQLPNLKQLILELHTFDDHEVLIEETRKELQKYNISLYVSLVRISNDWMWAE